MFGFGGQGKGLAVVAILIGLNAPARAGDVLYASLGDTTRSPIGWVEFCAENPGDCRGAASQPRDIVMSQTAWRDLLRVNRWVNETVKPITDMDHWGVIEKWSLPTDGYGDCEDYAVLLGVMYLGAGLRSAVVLAPEHAAALVYLPDYSWANVLLTVEGERGWVWAEATGGTNPLGWAPEEFLSERLLAFELVDEGLELGDLPDKPEISVSRHTGGSPELPGTSFFLVLLVLWLVARLFRRRAGSW